MEERLTVGDSLEVVIRLRVRQIGTDEFEVNFVLHITEENKCGHDTLPSRCLHSGAHFTIPHVGAGREKCSHSSLRHGQENGILVWGRCPVGDPVGLGGISEILRFRRDAIKRAKFVILRLADRSGHA